VAEPTKEQIIRSELARRELKRRANLPKVGRTAAEKVGLALKAGAAGAVRQTGQDILGVATGLTGGLVQPAIEAGARGLGQDISLPRGGALGQLVGAVSPIGVASRGAGLAAQLATRGLKAGRAAKSLRGAAAGGFAGGALLPTESATPDEEPFAIKNRVLQGLVGLALGGGGAAVVSKFAPKTPAQKILFAKQAEKRAEKLTAEILQPKTADLSDAISKGRKLPSIQRGAERIRQVESFEELTTVLDDAVGALFKERNAILLSNNTKVGSKPLELLKKFVQKERALERKVVSKPADIKTVDKVLTSEVEFLEANPALDIVQAQARKEFLQDITRPLLEKRIAGTLTGTENARLRAIDQLRAGYRKAILDSLPKNKAVIVDKINSQYEGLIDARGLAATQAAKAVKEVPLSILERIATSFGLSPKFTAARLLIKGVAGRSKLKKVTGRIEKLRKETELIRGLVQAAKSQRLS